MPTLHSAIVWDLPDGRRARLYGDGAYVMDENFEPILDQPVEVPDHARPFLESWEDE